MQQIPIYEVWLQSWTTQDLIVFGTLAAVALGLVITWAKKRATPSGETELGL